MSPNRFSVTITSNHAGLFTSSIAHESTSWWLTSTSGKPGFSSSTTCRQRREVAMTLALSTLVRRPRRARASSKPRRTTRRISASVYGSVSSAARSPDRAGRLLALAEVDAAGQLADDQEVDAGQQLRPERRRRDEAGMDRHRPEVGEQLQLASEREQALLRAGRSRSGRPTGARRPRPAGSRRPRRPGSRPPAGSPRRTRRSRCRRRRCPTRRCRSRTPRPRRRARAARRP